MSFRISGALKPPSFGNLLSPYEGLLSQKGSRRAPKQGGHRENKPSSLVTDTQRCQRVVWLSSVLKHLRAVKERCYFNYMKCFCFNYSNKRFFLLKLLYVIKFQP